MPRTDEKKRSPLKAPPLRNPGQSLDEEIERLIDSEGVPYLIASVFAIILAALIWFWYLLDLQPNPIFVTLIAIVVVAFSTYKVINLRKRLKSLKLGRDGEKIVGQYLEELREKGYRVFHDIICNGFNIDHVILSTRGIFTVETKTYSKPVKGKAIVSYDGSELLINGYEPEGDLVGQSAAQRNSLREILEESTGKLFTIRGVIVFPGWYIEADRSSQQDIWVLNPKALPKFIDNKDETLTDEDIKLASYHLARHIMTSYKS